ncbi:MAG: AzlC family ABC transporter permease [Pseudomonadales bacterium]
MTTLEHPTSELPSCAQEFFAGARATVPLIVGAIPFGIIFGTLAEPNGLSFAAAMLMSIVVFAGSSQFIALGLLAAGASIPVIVLTTFVVNLRHLLYSANLVSKVRHLPQYWRAVIAFGLTDETFAAVNNRYMQHSSIARAHWFYLGSFLAMYSNWILCTYLGLTLGNIFPNMSSWGLDFAMSVTFLGMVMPYLKSKPVLAAVAVASVLSIATYTMPHKLGLIVSAIGGICVGISFQALLKRSAKQHPKTAEAP